MELIEHTSTPLYKQIADKVVTDIEAGTLKHGDKLLSITEFAIEHEIARDTVEKAYKWLKERGIISATKGKGYFVSGSTASGEMNIFLHFNKLSVHKKWIYDAFLSALPKSAKVDVFIHHNDEQLFTTQLTNAVGHYTHYVIIPPHFTPYIRIEKYLSKIPKQKLYILDRMPTGWEKYPGVYQHFESDIVQALNQAKHLIKKYQKFTLVFPKTKGYSHEVMNGFTTFCTSIPIAFEVVSEIHPDSIKKGKVFLVIEDEDLVTIIKICKLNGYSIGSEVGIISYNDSPLKEILLDGITVITTDFLQMGKHTAELIISKKQQQIKNPFLLIPRNSL